MRAIVFGHGTIGKVLVQHLKKKGVSVLCIVRTNGIFDGELQKIGEVSDWKNFGEQADIAFLGIPTNKDGNTALAYALSFLEKGKTVVTCEKAAIAYHFDVLRKYDDLFLYSAAVGGGTRMLKEIAHFRESGVPVETVQAVVNGTLNYMSCRAAEGATKDEVVHEVLEKGFAEPGAMSFEEIIQAELNDVRLKTVILANASGLFDKVITTSDVDVVEPDFDWQNFSKKRCIVRISKHAIEVGFIEDATGKADVENTAMTWLPGGVLNALYINGEHKVTGPGAGAEDTVSAMLLDAGI
jgi:homoserine dehydrogenase